MNIDVRDAKEADLEAIVRIYNESIPGGWSTADTEPIGVSDRIDWFREHDPERRPIWVARIEGEIVAWIGLTSFYHDRAAYDATAEVSTYVASAFHKQGIATFLKKRMIDHCPRLGVTTLLSMHFDHNEATRRINERMGFTQVGHFTEIAVVRGQKRGLIISALRIPSPVVGE